MSASSPSTHSDQSSLGATSALSTLPQPPPHPPDPPDPPLPPRDDKLNDVVAQPAAPASSSPIEIAQESEFDSDADDGDSAIGDTESTASSTASLTVSNYQYENGRRYHAFRQGQYWLPNDDAEQDRLDLEHHIFRLILGGALFRSPIMRNPQRVLDMGTGTGIWAIEFADEFPSADVLGNDLSPIQPNWVPPNCRFVVDDIESEWLYKWREPFDFIHGRAVGGSIRDWPGLYSEIYKHLKPGGWVEIQEFEGQLRSDDDPELRKAPAIKQWQELVNEASFRMGQKFDVAGIQKQHMIDAGFLNVQEDIYKVPGGTWPQDPRQKEIGAYQFMHLIDCVEPFTLAAFKRALGWTDEEMTVIIAKVKNDMRNKTNYIYTNFYFVYGQKPYNA